MVTADSDLAAETLLANLAEMTTATADPNPADNLGAAWTRVDASAVLTLSKSHSPATFSAGELVT